MDDPVAHTIDLLPGDRGDLFLCRVVQRLLGKLAELHKIKDRGLDPHRI